MKRFTFSLILALLAATLLDCDDELNRAPDDPLTIAEPATSDYEPFQAGSCHRGHLFGWNYCSRTCPCGVGEGDCDSDRECQTGLKCKANVGAKYGVAAIVDVCENPNASGPDAGVAVADGGPGAGDRRSAADSSQTGDAGVARPDTISSPPAFTVSASGSQFVSKSASGQTVATGTAVAVIQATINAAKAKEWILFKAATYPITAKIRGKSGVSLIAEGSGVIFDLHQLTNEVEALSFEGSTLDSHTLTQDGKPGDWSITASGTASVVPGDLVFVQSNEVVKNNEADATAGELRVVGSVSGSTITFSDKPLQLSYKVSAAAKYVHLEVIRDVLVKGIKLVGDPTKVGYGIGFDLAYNCTVDGISCEHVKRQCVGVSDSKNVWVKNSDIRYSNLDGVGYGVVLGSAVEDSGTDSNVFYECRHAIAHGASSTPGYPLHLNHYRNKAYDCGKKSYEGTWNNSSAAFDCHAVGADINFIDNEVHGGIQGFWIQQHSGTYKGNKIYDVSNRAIWVIDHGIGIENIQLLQNEVYRCGTNGLLINSPNVTVDDLLIQDGALYQGDWDGVEISFDEVVPKNIKLHNVRANGIKNSSGIAVYNVSGLEVTGCTLRAASTRTPTVYSAYGMYIEAGTGITVHDNDFQNAGSSKNFVCPSSGVTHYANKGVGD